MRDARKRLEKLEVGAGKGAASRWEVPIGTRLYLTMVACHRARIEGEEPPEYSWEEILEMRRQDLETVAGNGAEASLRDLAGNGAEASLRDSIGWQTPEAQRMLGEWQEDARRRVQKVEGLPPERWHEVWGSEDEE